MSLWGKRLHYCSREAQGATRGNLGLPEVLEHPVDDKVRRSVDGLVTLAFQ